MMRIKFVVIIFVFACTSACAQVFPNEIHSSQTDSALQREFSEFKKQLLKLPESDSGDTNAQWVFLYQTTEDMNNKNLFIIRGDSLLPQIGSFVYQFALKPSYNIYNRTPIDIVGASYYGDEYKVVGQHHSFAPSVTSYLMKKGPDHFVDSLAAIAFKNEMEMERLTLIEDSIYDVWDRPGSSPETRKPQLDWLTPFCTRHDTLIKKNDSIQRLIFKSLSEEVNGFNVMLSLLPQKTIIDTLGNYRLLYKTESHFSGTMNLAGSALYSDWTWHYKSSIIKGDSTVFDMKRELTRIRKLNAKGISMININDRYLVMTASDNWVGETASGGDSTVYYFEKCK